MSQKTEKGVFQNLLSLTDCVWMKGQKRSYISKNSHLRVDEALALNDFAALLTQLQSSGRYSTRACPDKVLGIPL